MQLRTRNNALLACFVLTFCFFTMWSGYAFAQISNTDPIVISNAGFCPQYQGFIAKYVSCLTNAIVISTSKYIGTYVADFVNTVNIVLILGVVIYAFKIVSGKTRPVVAEGVVVALKLGGVVFGMNMLLEFYPLILQSIYYLAQTVMDYIPLKKDTYCGRRINGVTTLWNYMDCGLQLLLGLGAGVTLLNGILGFLVASLFSGGFGIAIFFFGIAIIYIVLITFFQAVFIFLSAYIALSFLMVIAPLMIPLVMLKQTKGFFEKWLRLVFTVILQPVFLFAYIGMALLLMDAVLFSGPFSLTNAITCRGTRAPIGTYISVIGAVSERSGKNAIWDVTINQNPNEIKLKGGEDTGVTGKVATDNSGRDSMYGLNNINIEVPSVAINFRRLAMACGTQYHVYGLRVMLGFILAATVIYVMYTMIGIIPFLGASVSGDISGMLNLSRIGKSMLPKQSPGSNVAGNAGGNTGGGGG